MSLLNQSAKVIWLHDFAGQLMAFVPGHIPQEVTSNRRKLFASRLVQESVTIRIAAYPFNSSLLLAYSEVTQQIGTGNATLQVCSGSFFSRSSYRDPQRMFDQLMKVARSPRAGGYRPWLAADRLALQCRQWLDTRSTEVPPQLLPLLREHPLYPFLSFVLRENPLLVAASLGYLLDPRWYASSADEDNWNGLLKSLHLVSYPVLDKLMLQKSVKHTAHHYLRVLHQQMLTGKLRNSPYMRFATDGKFETSRERFFAATRWLTAMLADAWMFFVSTSPQSSDFRTFPNYLSAEETGELQARLSQ